MSFIAGYLLGLEDGGSSAVLEPLTVSENGRYAPPEGVDGFDSVDVNVPDRYDDGYQDGYDIGYNTGYTEGFDDGDDSGCARCYTNGYNDGYDTGLAEGRKNGRYTFPDGTSYDDIKELVGGDCLMDETMGVGIGVSYRYYTSWQERAVTEIYLSFSDGSTLHINSWDTGTDSEVTVVSVSIDGSTGQYRIGYVRANDPNDIRYDEGSSPYLIGFGAEGHRYSVSN